jgi:hypothetical protein
MWRPVDFIRTDVSEEHVASIFSVVEIYWSLLTFLARDSFHPDDRGDTFLQNVGSYKTPHDATSQKTPFFIATAVKASNPTYNESIAVFVDRGDGPELLSTAAPN